MKLCDCAILYHDNRDKKKTVLPWWNAFIMILNPTTNTYVVSAPAKLSDPCDNGAVAFIARSMDPFEAPLDNPANELTIMLFTPPITAPISPVMKPNTSEPPFPSLLPSPSSSILFIRCDFRPVSYFRSLASMRSSLSTDAVFDDARNVPIRRFLRKIPGLIGFSSSSSGSCVERNEREFNL